VLLECAIRPAHNADGWICVAKGGLCARIHWQLSTRRPACHTLPLCAGQGCPCWLSIGSRLYYKLHLQCATISYVYACILSSAASHHPCPPRHEMLAGYTCYSVIKIQLKLSFGHKDTDR
jgi:hypothetical protein